MTPKRDGWWLKPLKYTLSTPHSSGSVSVAHTWPCCPSLNSTWPFLGQKVWGSLDGFCLFLSKQCTAKAVWCLVSQRFLTRVFCRCSWQGGAGACFPGGQPRAPAQLLAGVAWRLALPIEADLSLPFCCRSLLCSLFTPTTTQLVWWKWDVKMPQASATYPMSLRKLWQGGCLLKSMCPAAMGHFSSSPSQTAQPSGSLRHSRDNYKKIACLFNFLTI